MRRLPDNAAVMIQGAGGGLGAALVSALLESDSVGTLFAASRRPDALPWRDACVVPLPLDIAREADVAAAAQAVAAYTPRLDVLITCAGVLHAPDGVRPEKRLDDLDPKRLQASYAINAIGPALMLKHFHRFLIHGDRAVVAQLSARVGSIGDNRAGGWYAYRMSKAAQNQLTRTAAIELRRKSRQLICVGLHPGTTDTALSAPFQGGVPEDRLFTPAFAAERLLAVLDDLEPADSGGVFDWRGEPVVP